jgi:hypothetical protein
MNDNLKAQKYNQLMFEHTRIQNKISSLRGESLDLNQNQIKEIRELENRLLRIIEAASRL